MDALDRILSRSNENTPTRLAEVFRADIYSSLQSVRGEHSTGVAPENNTSQPVSPGSDRLLSSVLSRAYFGDNCITFGCTEETEASLDKSHRRRKQDPHEFKGSLFLIGGKSKDTFTELVKLAGPRPKVVVIGRASSQTNADESLAEDFVKEGVKAEDITIVVPKGHKSTDTRFKHQYEVPKDADVVFFGGGKQDKLRKEFDDHQLRQVGKLLRKGALVGGSSAGAAVMSTEMINGGDEKEILHMKGFGLAPWVIVDTHVGERDRQPRDATALYDIGKGVKPVIGLDEDTRVRLFWKGGKLLGEIGGKGTAHWVQSADMPQLKIQNRRVMSNIVTDGGKREAVMWELKSGDIIEIPTK